jgi:uncharacterized membrane protein YgdD (TMEM256/DUF423 family)
MLLLRRKHFMHLGEVLFKGSQYILDLPHENARIP